MFRWLRTNEKNEASVKRMEMQRENFLRIKTIQKMLGQSDRDSESYTLILHKFESLNAK